MMLVLLRYCLWFLLRFVLLGLMWVVFDYLWYSMLFVVLGFIWAMVDCLLRVFACLAVWFSNVVCLFGCLFVDCCVVYIVCVSWLFLAYCFRVLFVV